MAGFGVLALAATCCAAVPLIAAIAGALALGVFVSIAAAAIGVAAIAGALMIRARRRRDDASMCRDRHERISDPVRPTACEETRT